MNKNNLSLIAFALLIGNAAHAGGVVGCTLPKVVQDVVADNQKGVETLITAFNEGKESKYLFQPERYSSHKAFCFITQDPLSAKQIETQYPDISTNLEAIAEKHTSLDLTNNFNEAKPAIWPNSSNFNFKFSDGALRTNYYNLVLIASANTQLTALVQDVRTALLDKHGIEQKNEFAPQINLGKIYLQDGGAIGQDVLENLATYKAVLTALRKDAANPDKVTENVVITSFALKGHDGSETVFNLAQSKQ